MKVMRKLFIAALVLAAGCDATRRDYSYCDKTYSECNNGYVCDMTVGRCVLATDAGQPDTPWTPIEANPPVDVMPGEAGSDAKDAPIIDVAPIDVAPIDVSIVDVPIRIDVAGADSRVPDAPGSCAVDTDCSGSGLSHCVNARCVACKTSNHCSNAAGTPFCSAQNTCVSCAQATGAGVCSGATPMCDSGSGRCVECLGNSSCTTAAKAFCVAGKCEGCNVPGASSSSGGSVDGGVKDGGGVDAGAAAPACVGTKPWCASEGTMVGQCVQCLTSANCSGSTPICGSSSTCEGCSADKQCADLGIGPGICMYHDDKRCAVETETIYVQNSTTCNVGAGTAASPYCKPQDGLGAVNAKRRVLVLTGGAALSVWEANFADNQQVSAIGRQQATISAGASDIGVHVTKGNVYLRGLTLQGASSLNVKAVQPGIVVEGGAALAMDRCRIFAFAGGLLVKPGANFDVANSVIALNSSGQFGTTVFFGGVFLGGSAPATGPKRFWFNTVVNNDDRGILCADPQPLFGILATGNGNTGDYATCEMDKTSVWGSGKTSSDGNTSYSGDVSLDSSYHLKTTNRCYDLIDPATPHPTYDMDGEVRPKPTTGKLDCGADEL
jgi:hypothetical protein